MLSMLSRRRTIRSLAAVAMTVAAGALIVGQVLVVAPPASAAAGCASPGASGAGGTLGGVVNTYYPGVGTAAAGATSISLGSPSGAAAPIAAGDLLLVIEMQAADIDSTNTDSYGHGGAPATPASGYTALGSTGLYEYVRATSAVAASSVGISGLGPGAGLVNGYVTAAATTTAGQRTFQVVRVPQYTTATTSSTLTASAWNGSVGGVLALDTTGALTLAGTVSVSGLGFGGGVGLQRAGALGFLNSDVVASATAGTHGNKAEGIAGTPTGTVAGDGYPGGDVARGAPANAGGGGTDGRPVANDQNSGGGGGGNGGAGGVGGNTWNTGLPLGGYGGVALPATAGRVFLGGGGGAGTANNFGSPSSGGAAGGGIVLIRAGSVGGSGTVTADGAAAYNDTLNDGGGGGGGGGTIVVTSPSSSLAGATLQAGGGRGADAWRTQGGAGSAHGPGGGGGGGWILTSSAPAAATVPAGDGGRTTTGLIAFGAAPGISGQMATVPATAVPGVSGGAECADLSITKTGPGAADAGAALTYLLSVTNLGPADATSLSVSDTLPVGATFVSAGGTGWTCATTGGGSVTCTRPSLATGRTAPDITVAATASSRAPEAVNTATVTAATPDPTPANNTSTVTTTIRALADLSIEKTGPASVAAAGRVSYQLAVANAGPSDAGQATVIDTLPPGVSAVSATGSGWTCSVEGDVSVTCTRPEMPAGASAPNITVVVTAPPHAATLGNTAGVTSSVSDPRLSNNNSSIVTTVRVAADLSVDKSGPAEASAGGDLRYRLAVANAGPDTASSVELVDSLPRGVQVVSVGGKGWTCGQDGDQSVTCTRRTLADDAIAPAVLLVVVAPSGSGPLTNTAKVSASTPDPRPDNNSSTVRTEVTRESAGGLARTGGAVLILVPLGVVLLALGAVMLTALRRRSG